MVLTDADVAAYLAGKAVAVVGNASAALEECHGAEIDACDVVVRLNAGVPDPRHYAAIGSRTDVLQVGNLRVWKDSHARLCNPPGQVWFAKPTLWGDKEWSRVVREPPGSLPWWRVPNEEIARLREDVGAPPSGGAIAASVALRYAGSVRIFGFTHFAGGTWWHRERKKATVSVKGYPGYHNHDGEKERAWFSRMGLV